jgi:ABC-type amino acid transport substrate-binding protein
MRTYSLSIALLATALVAAGCRSTPIQNDLRQSCGIGVRATELCSADGVLFVLAVDDRRVLIAIDRAGTEKPDGFVDDLFLYTASEAHGFQSQPGAFRGHVEYDQNALRVVAKDARQSLLFLVLRAGDKAKVQFDTGVERRFDRSVGLSHYAGWRKLPLERLVTVHLSAQCDGPPGACVEVDGVRIRFPA